MPAQRKFATWGGKGGDAQRRGKADENPWLHRPFEECRTEAYRIDELRTRWQFDFLAFYNECLARPMRNRKTKQMEMQSLGRIHLLMRDFLTVEKDDCEKHSKLHHFIDRDEVTGDFPEQWLYWRTLDDTVPELQSGPEGPISKMFYGSFWQGVVIRLCGDGFVKCLLAPRGHLKSHVAGMYDTLWNCIRHPEERSVIKSVTGERATIFLDGLKFHFEQNTKFIDVFGHLKPEKREAAWNQEMIQLMCANRRGPDKTVVSSGMESDKTGSHGDNYLNDDIAGESNTLTAALRAKARSNIEKQQAQCDPGSNLTDVGTRWEEDDPHCMFVGEPDGSYSGCMADFASFMVVTVLDGDQNCKVSTNLSPLGYGKPIWGEKWTLDTVKQKRASMPDDRFWCGQYHNQFFGTTNRLFKPAWIRRMPEELVDAQGRRFSTKNVSLYDIAERLKLNITIGADTASGLPTVAERAKRDDTGVFVMGQTPDRKTNFLLDGLREKLPVELIATGMLNLIDKWYGIAKGYGGTFRAGFEQTRWEKVLSPILADEQRKRGMNFPIELIPTKNIPKVERIRWLVPAYKDGRMIWPETLVVDSYLGREPYDLCFLLESEFTAYNPYATVDNLLDAHAYAYKIAVPTPWKQTTVKETPIVQVSQYSRSMTEATPRMAMGDFEEVGQRSMGIGD